MDLERDLNELIIDLRWENKLLRHILHCETCKGRIRKMIERNEEPRPERWSNIFLKDLPERYRPFNNTASAYYRDCPRYEDYPSDTGRFIEDRIRWRIEVNKKILTEAELELEGLRKQRNSVKQPVAEAV